MLVKLIGIVISKCGWSFFYRSWGKKDGVGLKRSQFSAHFVAEKWCSKKAT